MGRAHVRQYAFAPDVDEHDSFRARPWLIRRDAAGVFSCTPAAAKGAAMILRSASAHDVAILPVDPARRGYGLAYRSDRPNFCPGCGRSHWYVGRVLAECGFCGTALPLAEHGAGRILLTVEEARG